MLKIPVKTDDIQWHNLLQLYFHQIKVRMKWNKELYKAWTFSGSNPMGALMCIEKPTAL